MSSLINLVTWVLPVEVEAVEVVLGDEGQGLAHEGAPLLGRVHQLAVLPTLSKKSSSGMTCLKGLRRGINIFS